jgi:hypothetical protein
VANLTGAVWRKSSRSSGQGGNCVEVAHNLTGIVGVRDSKDLTGPALVVAPEAFRAFTEAVEAGDIA